jgi:hypothetical protein
MTSASDRSRKTRPRSPSRAAADRYVYVYVYAAVSGQPGPALLSKIPPMPEGHAARTVPLTRAITLVVADVPAATYRPERLEPRLGDGDWVAACGAAHHTAADVLSRGRATLPFRMFTLFSSDARLLARLKPAAARMARALAAVDGRAEWVLRVGAPDPARAADAGSETAARGAGSSGTSFLQQKAAAKRARVERAARVKSHTAALFASLDRLADRAVEREVPAGTSLLLDAAFLIETRRSAAFKRALGRSAQALLDDGCPVSLTGPWPPYSFASIENSR